MAGQAEDTGTLFVTDALEKRSGSLDLVTSPRSVLQPALMESLDSEGGAAASPDFGSPPSTSKPFRAEDGGEQRRGSECSVSGQLRELFPARETEIRQFLGLLGEPFDYLLPLLVYGGSATGKTSIVKQAFNFLGRPYAYASIRYCHSPRLLFESILNQLEGHVRSASNNYCSAKRCDRITDFVSYLSEACAKAIARCCGARKAGEDKDQQPCGFDTGPPVVYILIDNLELIRHWSGGSSLLSALVRLPELAGLPNLGLVFISNVGPNSFHCGTGFRDLSPLFFRDYNDEALRKILLKQSSRSDLYPAFLSQVLPPFARITSRLTEISQSLEPLYRKYCEPVDLGSVNPTTKLGRTKLTNSMKKHVLPALSQSFPVDTYGSEPSCATDQGGRGRKKRTSEKYDFHLSACSKYLLLAAYLASRNAATLDGALFDSTAPEKGSKRRRCSVLSVEKKDLQIREKQMKGPGSFSLERLLAIFKCIVHDHSGDSTSFQGAGPISLTADVLMQLSALVSVSLLIKGSSNLLEGSSRYCCNVDEDFIQEVARSVNFRLSNYLLHG